ncbi:hypothetical protein [Amorphus sp. 3PC139-8]|uniref:hypothetical protein n=1 Tax=Amorphus sp. 3PC139-8 TaxID=2735676 RepID=UPI00345D3635
MISAYTHRVTIACPASLAAAGAQLGLLVGRTAYDDQVFDDVIYQDGSGVRYARPTFLVTAGFREIAESDLTLLPNPFEADLNAALRAQALLRVYDEPTPADPAHIVAIVHDDTDEAMAAVEGALGLSLIDPDPL